MKLNIRSHDTGAKTLEELIVKLDEFDLDGVQLVPYKIFDDVPYLPNGITKKKAEKIGKVLSGKIPLIGAYFNPVHSNIEKRTRCKTVFCDYLANAGLIGSCIVGSETGSYNDDKWTYNPLNRTEKALKIVTETFCELCGIASGFNVNVGIEGAAGHVCYDVKTLSRAVELINSKSLKIIFDLYNFLDGTNYNDYLKILADGLKEFNKNICVFHIKDFILADGVPKQVAVGKGIINFESVFSLIKKHDENAQLVLEGTVGDDIIPSVKFIKEVWGKI